jgi:formylglycine-generating enzyme required for sulfatase activity
LDKIAWHSRNSGDKTHPVAEKDPNDYGLYDMLGNVWEWMDDLYLGANLYRSLRGGSWNENPVFVSVSVRERGKPDDRNLSFGFRCVVNSSTLYSFTFTLSPPIPRDPTGFSLLRSPRICLDR